MSTVNYNYQVVANDMVNAGNATLDIRRTLKKYKLPKSFIRRVAIASYEAEINIVIHSYGGTVDFSILNDGNKIILFFKDIGPGIEEIELAMKEGFSTASEAHRAHGFGAGMGLANMKEAADEMNIESSIEGTMIELIFYNEV